MKFFHHRQTTKNNGLDTETRIDIRLDHVSMVRNMKQTTQTTEVASEVHVHHTGSEMPCLLTGEQASEFMKVWSKYSAG